MFREFHVLGLALATVAGLMAQPVFAETPNEILASIQKEAAGTPGLPGGSSAHGPEYLPQDRLVCLGSFNGPECIIQGMYLVASNSCIPEKQPIGNSVIAFSTARWHAALISPKNMPG